MIEKKIETELIKTKLRELKELLEYDKIDFLYEESNCNGVFCHDCAFEAVIPGFAFCGLKDIKTIINGMRFSEEEIVLNKLINMSPDPGPKPELELKNLKKYLVKVVDKATDSEVKLSKLRKDNAKLRKEIKELKKIIKRLKE